MRIFLWLLTLFGVATGLALIARFNPGNVVFFYPPYRIDLSLNFFLLLTGVLFYVLSIVLNAIRGVREMAARVAITGIALRLDSIVSQIDSMPLLADEKPTLPATQPKNGRRTDAKADSGKAGVPGEWQSTLEDKFHGISNAQVYYARENLKLRLLNARLALLSRNESAFRSDLAAAQDAIIKYFDTRTKQAQTVQALLTQVQGSNLPIEMPTLADSLDSVRNYKAKP